LGPEQPIGVIIKAGSILYLLFSNFRPQADRSGNLSQYILPNLKYLDLSVAKPAAHFSGLEACRREKSVIGLATIGYIKFSGSSFHYHATQLGKKKEVPQSLNTYNLQKAAQIPL